MRHSITKPTKRPVRPAKTRINLGSQPDLTQSPHFTVEPPHDKTNNVVVCPAKTQISLGIRPVWSESSLSAWRKLEFLASHWAHSEDSDQTGRMPRLIWVFAGRTYHFVGFVMRRLSFVFVSPVSQLFSIFSVTRVPHSVMLLNIFFNCSMKRLMRSVYIFALGIPYSKCSRWKL